MAENAVLLSVALLAFLGKASRCHGVEQRHYTLARVSKKDGTFTPKKTDGITVNWPCSGLSVGPEPKADSL